MRATATLIASPPDRLTLPAYRCIIFDGDGKRLIGIEVRPFPLWTSA